MCVCVVRVCVCVHMHAGTHMCIRGLSPSTMLVLEIELRTSTLAASPLTSEPSHLLPFSYFQVHLHTLSPSLPLGVW